MEKTQLERYSRHIMLPEIGVEGQQRLLDSRVLVIGLGGLGAPAVMYLASAGVGELVLADYDHVELSNLQRQIIHKTTDIGRNKVDSAADMVAALNPDVHVSRVGWELEGDELIAEISRADVVVDASDNFETRFILNAACVETGTPLVSGAAVRMEGQVSVFLPAEESSPCYRCLYEDDGEAGEACSRAGAFAPLLGIIGSIQAAETLKVLLGHDGTLAGRLLLLDASTMHWRSVKLVKDPSCPTCSGKSGAKATGT